MTSVTMLLSLYIYRTSTDVRGNVLPTCLHRASNDIRGNVLPTCLHRASNDIRGNVLPTCLYRASNDIRDPWQCSSHVPIGCQMTSVAIFLPRAQDVK